jgi:hypothetical protein
MKKLDYDAEILGIKKIDHRTYEKIKYNPTIIILTRNRLTVFLKKWGLVGTQKWILSWRARGMKVFLKDW